MTERLIATVNVRNVNRVSAERDPKPLKEGHYNRMISEVASKTRHSGHTPEEVSRKFNIGIERSKETIKVTTQKGIHHAVHPLHHRYHVDHMQFNRKRLNVQFYCDYLESKTKSLDGNTGAWIYTTGKFTAVYPVESQKEAGNTFRRFTEYFGIPD